MEKGRGKRTDTLQRDNDYLRRGDVKRLLENVVCLHEELPAQIDLIPAADVVPVRHGRWVTKKDACGRDYTICSACETEIKWRDRRGVMLIVDMQNAPYCPNCGAKMDKDGDGDV